MMSRKPYINVDTTSLMPAHGFSKKRKIVIHETISHDREGLSDITSIANYLGNKDYGVHLIVDQEGKSGYSKYERAIYYHVKGANKESIGIEKISYIPALNIGRWKRLKIWLGRERQLHKTARWCAYYSKKHGIPLVYSKGKASGIMSHWDVTQSQHIAGGHWDAHPKHRGGHYPMKRLIKLARLYRNGKLTYKPMKSFGLGQST